jgi:ribosomal protein S18 acetylase RimI-like enzyme
VPITDLDPSELDALEALEARIISEDGVRLKLEWHSVREARTAASLVWHEAGQLVGFLGLYTFGGPPNVELVGMVDPEHRRRGIATQLLDRGLAICGERGFTHRLLVVPREAEVATAMVTARGAVLEHSEYSLVLESAPQRPPEDPLTTIRDAGELDRADQMRILTAGFGPPPGDMLARLRGEGFRWVVVEHAGAPVGTARLMIDGERGYIGAFAVDPEYRGRGIGRDALGRFCTDLRGRGPDRVELQVEVENDTALGLYLTTGFRPVSTEDYYKL